MNTPGRDRGQSDRGRVVSSPDDASGVEPAPPALPSNIIDAARRLFGERLGLAERYAELLMTDGVIRGLIGPREAPRIWDRHLLNCAAVAELVPQGSAVIDVGSGAGLPGLVLAIARPDLSVALIEPLARRTSFLCEVVEELGLPEVRVVRARAEEALASVEPADVVVARALAPLDRLIGWCLPLTRPAGHVLAMKGDSAAEELKTHTQAVVRAGGQDAVIRVCAQGLLDPPTTVIDVVRGPGGQAAESVRRRSRRR
jgi:16S rRNA (guanine527-N7)-methyltransferase